MTRPARRFSWAFALGVGATLVQGPDGNLCALTDSNELWRIVPG